MIPGPLDPEVVAAHVEAQRARRVAAGGTAHLEDADAIDLIARIVARDWSQR